MIRSRYGPSAPSLDARAVLPGLAAAVKVAGSLAPAKGAAAGTAEVERHLRSAWGTELLLEMTGAFIDDELVGLANNWTVVQSYYAAYHAFLALLAAQGAALPAHHEGTQRAWAIFWTGRRLDLPPWALGYGPKGCLNVPAGHVVNESIHSWVGVTNKTCIDLTFKALRTTRDEHVPEAVRRKREELRRDAQRAWRAAEEARLAVGRGPRKPQVFVLPRLTAGEQAQVRERVRARTLLDYLYRLRVKTNYEDAAMFVEGAGTTAASRAVFRALRDITAATLFVLELHVAALTGGTWLADLAAGWASDHVPSGDQRGVVARIGFL
jgi:hypothetical protein